MTKRSKSEIENFVTGWVAENVCPIPGLVNLPFEVDRLAAALTGAARAQGISGSEINRALGDIDEYLTEQYHQNCTAAP